ADVVGRSPARFACRLTRLQRGDKAFAVPRQREADISQAVWPIYKASYGHRKEQVGVIGVWLAPVFSYPCRDVVVFAPDICEGPHGEDRVVRPWSRLSGYATEPDSLALSDPIEKTGGGDLFHRCDSFE